MRPDPADLELVRGLVEIPSVSRREGDAVEWLVARMGERGFRASVDDAGNAVGEIGDGPVHVVLLGHIDTVPGEIAVHIEGDELVGRGAVDAKGPLAAPDWCVIGEPSGWDAVTVAYKGRLTLDLALTREARHGASPGPTIAEEALALWGRVRESTRVHNGGARSRAR